MLQRYNIKAVTFDLDDTLWAIGPVIAEAERALWDWLAEHCPGMTARYDHARLAPVRESVLAESPHLLHDISALRVEILRRALHDCGYADAARRAEAAFDVFMHARHTVAYFDDVLHVLQTLTHRYRLGVVTNGNADVMRLSIGRYFDFAISAASVGISKPDPAPFEAALRAAGCAPAEMLHVGDHHDHDVAGAHRLGIHTVWVNPERKPFPGEHPPLVEIAALAELPELLGCYHTRP